MKKKQKEKRKADVYIIDDDSDKTEKVRKVAYSGVNYAAEIISSNPEDTLIDMELSAESCIKTLKKLEANIGYDVAYA